MQFEKNFIYFISWHLLILYYIAISAADVTLWVLCEWKFPLQYILKRTAQRILRVLVSLINKLANVIYVSTLIIVNNKLRL